MNENIITILTVIIFSVSLYMSFDFFFKRYTKKSSNSSGYNKIRILALVIAIIISTALALFARVLDASGPPQVNGELVYRIHIEEQESLEAVANLRLIIEVDGQTAAIATTDSNGLSVLLVDSYLKGQSASLIVEATGYAIHVEEVELTVGGLPEVVRLKAEPEAIKEPDRN